MKEDPTPNKSEDSVYKGDDILKKTGEVMKFKELEKFALEHQKENEEFIFQGKFIFIKK